MTLFQAFCGYPPPNFFLHQPTTIHVPEVDVFLKERFVLVQLLQENLTKEMKLYADKKRSEREFIEGDMVYPRLQPYIQSSLALRRNKKLAPRFYGPYQVFERIGKVTHKLDLPDYSKIHNVLHVSLLKKKLGNSNLLAPTLPLVGPEGQMLVEPVAILDRRMIKRNNTGVNQVLAQWSNGLPADTTWED